MESEETSHRRFRRYHLMKWIGLVVGFSAKFISGSLFVFNAYEDALKTTFNFTAKEVQLQSSLLNIGLGVGFLPGMFYDRFGPQWASAAGLVVSLTSYLLLWSTTKSVHFYHINSWLMSIYFFLCGLGSVFTYMVALNTNAINFSEKHRGKIVGFLNAFFAGSPSVFSTLYFHVIGRDDPKSGDSFSSLMLVFAVCFGVIDVLCIALIRVHPRPNTELPEQKVKQISDDNASNVHTEENKKTSNTNSLQDLSMIGILTTLDYHLLTWMFTLASTTGLVYTIALTQTTAAVNLDSHNADIVLVIPITNAIVSAITGVFSDIFKQRFPRLGILLAGIATFIVCHILVVGLPDNYVVLVTATVFNGIGQGVIWSIAPAVMSELFSIKNLGRNWGFALFTASLVSLAGQVSFGALYDAAITSSDDVYCYGVKCVRWGHVVSLCMSVMAMALGIILYIRTKKL